MSFARRVLSGTLQLTIVNGVVRVLSIITMPILTRALAPDAYGVAALISSVIALVSVFALMGLDMSYARSVSSPMSERQVAIERYCWQHSLLAAVGCAGPAAICWYLAAPHNRGDAYSAWIAGVVFVGILLSVCNTMSQTRARVLGRYRALSISLLVSGVAGAIASIAIAKWWRADETALLAANLITYFVPIGLLGVPSLRGLAKRSNLARPERWAIVRIGLAGIITAPMYWLLSSSDRWFLDHYRGTDDVGIYSISYSVAILGAMVNTAVMAVWLPEASREFELDPVAAATSLGRLMSRLIVVMAIVWLVAAAAGGDVIRMLASPRFHGAAAYVPLIAGAVFFYGVSQFGLYGLVLVKQLRLGAVWWLVGGACSAALNLALVPRFGALGASLTQLLSFALIAIALLATSLSKYYVRLDAARLAAVLLVVGLAGAAMNPAWHPIAAISLAIKIPVGIAIAVLALWTIAPDWCARAAAYVVRMQRGSA